MKKRGDFRFDYLIAGILVALAVYFAIHILWTKTSPVIFGFKLIPGLEQEIPFGASIVGVNLKTGSLNYFTGERWVKIENSNQPFTLGKYQFIPENIKNEINNFYFNTARRPDKLKLEVNNWRYWDVSSLGALTFAVYPKTKDFFVQQDAVKPEYDFIELNIMNEATIKSTPTFATQGYYSPDFAKTELDKYPDKIVEVTSWRDSILQGGKCEKFLDLALKEDKKDVNKKYTLRRVDYYLFIDLKKPVFDSTTPKWDDLNCFGLIYEDKSMDLKNYATLLFKYTNRDGYGSWYNPVAGQNVAEKIAYSKEFGWLYSKDNEELIEIKSANLNRVPDVYWPLSNIGAYEGIVLLTKPNGIFEQKDVTFNSPEEGVIIYDSNAVEFRVDLGFIASTSSEWGEWTGDQKKKSQIINKFIYDVLTEYYKNFKNSGGIN